MSRRSLGDRDLELEVEESETRALGYLSMTAGETSWVARVFGGERRMGFVSGQTGMAFDDGVPDRERARGAKSCVSRFLDQKKSGNALLWGVAALLDDTSWDRFSRCIHPSGCAALLRLPSWDGDTVDVAGGSTP